MLANGKWDLIRQPKGIVFPSTPRFSKWAFAFAFPHQTSPSFLTCPTSRTVLQFGDQYSQLSLQCHEFNSSSTSKSDDISKPPYRLKHCITIIRLQQSPEVLVLCFMFAGIHYDVLTESSRRRIDKGQRRRQRAAGSRLPTPSSPPQTGQLLAIKGARLKSIIDTHPL